VPVESPVGVSLHRGHNPIAPQAQSFKGQGNGVRFTASPLLTRPSNDVRSQNRLALGSWEGREGMSSLAHWGCTLGLQKKVTLGLISGTAMGSPYQGPMEGWGA